MCFICKLTKYNKRTTEEQIAFINSIIRMLFKIFQRCVHSFCLAAHRQKKTALYYVHKINLHYICPRIHNNIVQPSSFQQLNLMKFIQYVQLYMINRIKMVYKRNWNIKVKFISSTKKVMAIKFHIYKCKFVMMFCSVEIFREQFFCCCLNFCMSH